MFSKNVRRVLRSGYLCENKVTPSHSVLDPQIGHMQVPYLAQATAPTNANGSRSIGQDLHFEVCCQIGRKGLKSKCSGRTPTYPTQFGFARLEGDSGLGEAPVFDRMRPTKGDSSRSASSSGLASTKVCVHIHLQCVIVLLIRASPHHT